MSEQKRGFKHHLRRAQRATAQLVIWFPIRVWRRVLQYNGLLLSAGVSYQALFATFAAVYVGISVFGLWFVSEDHRLTTLIESINAYIPGLIGPKGAITREQVVELAHHNFSQFGWAGAVAVVLLIWTSSSWITYSRMAIRSVFGLPKDTGGYLRLKGIDLITALVLGGVLLIGTALTTAATNLFTTVAGWIGLDSFSHASRFWARVAALILVFVIDAVVLGAMFLILSGAELRVRQVRTGALLGGVALVLLQLLGSFVLGRGVSNPLLATFVTFVTLLLWFRLTAIVTLTAAAWIAERAIDQGEPIRGRVRKPSRWLAG